MRLARFFLHVLVVAAVLGLATVGAGAQDEGSAEPTSDAPPRSDEAAYTQWFVRQAIERYDATGREPTVEYYNDPAGIDGQWYVFIVGEDGVRLANANRPDLLGISIAGRRDVFGTPYGAEIVAATEQGSWVDYYFTHPETRRPEQKHTWVVRHDGLIFGSGWYDVDGSDAPPKTVPRAYARYLVAEAIDRYDTHGRDYAIDYHNSPESLDGEWYVGIISSDGISLANAYRPDLVGTDISNLTDTTGKNFGQEIIATPPEGVWIDYLFPHPETGEDTGKHSWGVRHDDLLFGAGWYDSGEVPPRTNVAGYTQYVVHEAVERYVADGRDAVVEHYSDPATIDGQWYVFVIDGDGTMLALPRRHDLLGTDVADLVDVNGKAHGAEIATAGTGGLWVDYYSVDPVDGETKLKYAWVFRYDGLLFGSGWYTVPEPPADDGDVMDESTDDSMDDDSMDDDSTDEPPATEEGPNGDVATG